MCTNSKTSLVKILVSTTQYLIRGEVEEIYGSITNGFTNMTKCKDDPIVLSKTKGVREVVNYDSVNL